jgi:hypothetical protein
MVDVQADARDILISFSTVAEMALNDVDAARKKWEQAAPGEDKQVAHLGLVEAQRRLTRTVVSWQGPTKKLAILASSIAAREAEGLDKLTRLMRPALAKMKEPLTTRQLEVLKRSMLVAVGSMVDIPDDMPDAELYDLLDEAREQDFAAFDRAMGALDEDEREYLGSKLDALGSPFTYRQAQAAKAALARAQGPDVDSNDKARWNAEFDRLYDAFWSALQALSREEEIALMETLGVGRARESESRVSSAA